MKFLLDTNTCIAHFRRGQASLVTSRILAMPTTDIVLCSVVRGELLVGALKSNNPVAAVAEVEKFASTFHSLPFDDISATQYAEIRTGLERLGTPIGPNDLLIAAIALTNGLIIVTSNVNEYRRVPGLIVEDWSQP